MAMERTTKIIRRSIHTFLQSYQFFTTIPLLIAFPFSLSLLISQSLLVPSSPLLPLLHRRLSSLFSAAGFPPSSQLFTILNLKLSQTIASSLFLLPLSLSSLLLSKSSVIRALIDDPRRRHHHQTPLLSIYPRILHTYLCNSLVIVSVNATIFSLLFFAFNSLQAVGCSASSSPTSILLLSAAGAVTYSIVLANALIVCNLALIVSGMENSGGYVAILKACVLIRGRAATALSLALPVNLGLAAVEALFGYRVVRAYYQFGEMSYSMALEGLFIAYLYSIFLVLDTIVSCVFYRSCKAAAAAAASCRVEHEEEYKYSYRIGIEEEDGRAFVYVKALEELP